jgi:hypothetical protein
LTLGFSFFWMVLIQTDATLYKAITKQSLFESRS